jgi:predicted nucleic acid-binding protein
MQSNYFCLFSARHELPNNPLPLFQFAKAYNIANMTQHRTLHFENAINQLRNGLHIKVYVTGFSPALIDFLYAAIAFQKQIIFLHYDSHANCYIEQIC